jgi:hypothetical protein
LRRADKLTTFMCRVPKNLTASTSWNSQGLSRAVKGLLCIIIAFGRKNPVFQGHRNAVTAYKIVADFIFQRQKLTRSEARKLQQHERLLDSLT